LTIDTSQNVGIGTSSPAGRLDVLSADDIPMYFRNASANIRLRPYVTSYATSQISALNAAGNAYTPLAIGGSYTVLESGGTERMRIDSSGNVGIGTSSPSAKLHVYGGDQVYEKATTGEVYAFYRNGVGEAKIQMNNSGQLVLGTTTTGGKEVIFVQNNSERVRIDTSGNLLVGKTSTSTSAAGVVIAGNGSADFGQIDIARPPNAGMLRIINSSTGSTVGAISQNGSSTTYATSSDYRLKNSVQPMQNALATVSKLKPVTYKWNADDSDSQGFIAHELQAVVPECVTGEKDAVDEDGNPKYQGIDTSFLVATLTAAIQEQQALITTLTERITALEAK
jgi:hypothetical protein